MKQHNAGSHKEKVWLICEDCDTEWLGRYFTCNDKKTRCKKCSHARRNSMYKKSAKGKITCRKWDIKRYWQDPEYCRKKAVARFHKVTMNLVAKIYERDKACQLCRSTDRLEIDHIYPVCLGGKGKLDNLQVLCKACNLFKGKNLLLPGGGMLYVR